MHGDRKQAIEPQLSPVSVECFFYFKGILIISALCTDFYALQSPYHKVPPNRSMMVLAFRDFTDRQTPFCEFKLLFPVGSDLLIHMFLDIKGGLYIGEDLVSWRF